MPGQLEPKVDTLVSPDGHENGNAKAGHYPNADRPNLFGTLLLQFYQTEEKAKAFDGMFALTIPYADQDFLDKYGELVEGKDELDYAEMHVLVIEMCKLNRKAGMWDYDSVPTGDAHL